MKLMKQLFPNFEVQDVQAMHAYEKFPATFDDVVNATEWSVVNILPKLGVIMLSSSDTGSSSWYYFVPEDTCNLLIGIMQMNDKFKYSVHPYDKEREFQMLWNDDDCPYAEYVHDESLYYDKDSHISQAINKSDFHSFF